MCCCDYRDPHFSTWLKGPVNADGFYNGPRRKKIVDENGKVAFVFDYDDDSVLVENERDKGVETSFIYFHLFIVYYCKSVDGGGDGFGNYGGAGFGDYGGGFGDYGGVWGGDNSGNSGVSGDGWCGDGVS